MLKVGGFDFHHRHNFFLNIFFIIGQYGALKFSSMLVLTKNELQFEFVINRMDGFLDEMSFRRRKYWQVPVPQSVPGIFYDFDYEHSTNRLSLIARDNNPESRKSRMFFIDFSRISMSNLEKKFDWIEFVDLTSDRPLMDRVRFHYDNKRVELGFKQPSDILLWSMRIPSSLRHCRFDSNFMEYPEKLLQCKKMAHFGDDWNVINSKMFEMGIWRIADVLSDDLGLFLWVIYHDVSSDQSSSLMVRREMVNSTFQYSRVKMKSLISIYFRATYSFKMAFDSQRKEGWVALVQTEPEINIIIHRFQPYNGSEQSLIIDPPFGDGVYPTRILRLSVHRRVACISVMTTSGKQAIVVVKLTSNLKHSFIGRLLLMDGLIGAVCLSDSSTALFSSLVRNANKTLAVNQTLASGESNSSMQLPTTKHAWIMLAVTFLLNNC